MEHYEDEISLENCKPFHCTFSPEHAIKNPRENKLSIAFVNNDYGCIDGCVHNKNAVM